MNLSKRLVVTNHSNNDIEWLSGLKSYGFNSINTYIYTKEVVMVVKNIIT